MASRSWNRVELIGNLTRDPEMRYTPQGTAVATFSLATNRTYNTPDGERKEEVDFHRCVAWGKLAELCQQLLKKGTKTFVSGRLQNREWEGQDGQKRQTTEIVIEDMILLTSRDSGSYNSEYNGDTSSSRPSGYVPRQTPAAVPIEEPKVADEPSSSKEAQADKKAASAPADEPVREKVPQPDENPAKEEIKDEELEDLPF
jgi:single-strand DNA-binding protein